MKNNEPIKEISKVNIAGQPMYFISQPPIIVESNQVQLNLGEGVSILVKSNESLVKTMGVVFHLAQHMKKRPLEPAELDFEVG